jgi:lipopolysaccharide exporter
MDLKSIVKSSLSLLSGVVGAQLINLAITPILTRLFSPEEFGQLSIFTSFSLSFVILATLKYEFAIPTEKNDNKAKNLVDLSVVLLILFSCIILLSGILFPGIYTKSLGLNKSLTPFLFFGVLSTGLYQIATYWSSREEEFNRIAISKVIVAVVVSIGSIISGIAGWGVIGLLVSYVFGRFISFAYILPRSISLFNLQIKKLKSIAIKYRDFPRFTAVASFVNIIGTQASPLVFSVFYTNAEIGLFSLGMRIIVLPAQLISQSLGQVLYSMFSKNNEIEKDRFLDLVCLLFCVSLPVFTITNLIGSDLFAFLFGQNWSTSGYYASVMSIWLIFSFVSAPLSHLAYIKRKNKSALRITLVETLLRLIAITLGFYFGGMRYSVIGFTVAGIMITTFYIRWILSLFGVPIMELIVRLKLRLAMYFGVLIVNQFTLINSYYIVFLVMVVSIIDLFFFVRKLDL